MTDIAADALGEVLPDRPLRSYPALLSTGADALAWARAGAPEGAVVVADYQASPRGRGGLPWEVHPGEGLGFSIVLRPDLTADREGWLYSVAVSGLADVLEPGTIAWPDEVVVGDGRAALVGVHAELGPAGVDWAVVSVLVPQATPPRGPLLARVVDAIETRYRSADGDVLADYRPRCTTLGRTVRARMVPLGPAGVEVEGTAVDCLADGALVLAGDGGRRVAVRPQHLGALDDAG